jgi:hypothetical protein
LYICGLLSSQAYQNNCDLLNTVIQYPNNLTSWEWTTAEAALTVLNRQYETLDLSFFVSIAFDKCQQKNCLFQNFLAKFIGLARKYKKTEEQRVEVLKKKVSKLIAKALSTLDTSPLCNNFTAWAAKC